MKRFSISPDLRVAVLWLLGALFVLQGLIVPWTWGSGLSSGGLIIPSLNPVSSSGYAPIWSPPHARALVDAERLLVQLLSTSVAIAAWVWASVPSDQGGDLEATGGVAPEDVGRRRETRKS